ncbi:unnamed protein product, partial [Ectocarpus sp. 8 AP-2014]
FGVLTFFFFQPCSTGLLPKNWTGGSVGDPSARPPRGFDRHLSNSIPISRIRFWRIFCGLLSRSGWVNRCGNESPWWFQTRPPAFFRIFTDECQPPFRSLLLFPVHKQTRERQATTHVLACIPRKKLLCCCSIP